MMSLENIRKEYKNMCLNADAAKNLKNLASIKDFENLFLVVLKSITLERRKVIKKMIGNITNEKQEVEKDSAKSIAMRQRGNELYAKCQDMEDFLEVFKTYNESIAYAPNKSEELALSYANRAMVLFRLKYFNECLDDINRALCSNYPEKTMGKLLIQKVRCMKIINHPDLEIIYNDTVKWIDKHAEVVEELRAELKKAYEEEAPPYSASICMQFRDELLEQMKQSCPNLDKVKIRRSTKRDLALVATRDIHVGEVIAVQKMYTQICHMEKPYLACWQCSVMCLNPVPCDYCTIATFCSEWCKAYAWSKHHSYECQIIFVIKRIMPDFLLPIRICMNAMKQLGGILPLMEEVYEMSRVDDMKEEHRIVDGAYPSESYRSVYYMINKSSVENLNYTEDVVRISTAVYFIATRTALFDEQYQGEMYDVMEEKVPKFFASLILRHFVMLQQLSKIRRPNDFVMGSIAVCPLFYIMNHSCNPNSMKLTLKDHQVAVAIDEIKKGQIINFSYVNQDLVEESTAERSWITKEMFTLPCKCEVCIGKYSYTRGILLKDLIMVDPIRLKELLTIYRKADQKLNKLTLSFPKTATEFLKETAALFKDLEPFSAVAPEVCKEKSVIKNDLLCLYFRLHRIIYNCLQLDSC